MEGEIGEQEVDECGWMLMGFDGWLKLVWVGLMDVVDGGKLGHWKEVVR